MGSEKTTNETRLPDTAVAALSSARKKGRTSRIGMWLRSGPGLRTLLASGYPPKLTVKAGVVELQLPRDAKPIGHPGEQSAEAV